MNQFNRNQKPRKEEQMRRAHQWWKLPTRLFMLFALATVMMGAIGCEYSYSERERGGHHDRDWDHRHDGWDHHDHDWDHHEHHDRDDNHYDHDRD